MINLFENFPDSRLEDLQNDNNYQNWLDIETKPNKKLKSGLALVDLDGTVRKPISDAK